MIFSTRDKVFDGAIWFGGSKLPLPEQFGRLKELGCELSIDKTAPDCKWEMTIKHPKWGIAKLACPSESTKADLDMIQDTAFMTPAEMVNFGDDLIAMGFEYQGDDSSIFSQYKNALRMINAIGGDDGIGCVDYNNCNIWTARSLANEVSHDAMLDPQQLLGFHMVRHDNKSVSLHSHGLGGLGFFDFEILSPDPDLTARDYNVLRSIVLEIIQSNLTSTSDKHPLGNNNLRMMPVGDFGNYANMDDLYLRRFTDDDAHRDKRSICCQVPKKLLGKFTKGAKPAKFLTTVAQGHPQIRLNDELTGHIANRSQKTWPILLSLAEDFKEFNFTIQVKLKCQDSRGNDLAKQPLWFHVNELNSDEAEATLKSKPDFITELSVGYSDTFVVEKILDWRIETPLGYVTSYNDLPARFIMQQDEQFRKALRLIARRQTGQITTAR